MSESGDRLDRAYRALPREEPGAAIDAAILAASRRAAAKPSASRRWAAPASIAAVLVLAFGVTLHMREEKPGVESPEVFSAPASTTAEPPASASKEEVQAKRAQGRLEPAPKPAKKVAPAAKPDADSGRELEIRERSLRDEAAPAAPPAPAVSAAAPAPERKDLAPQAAPAEPALQKEADMKLNRATSAAAPPVAAARMKAAQPIDEPTRELEAIAKLRVEGRVEEADKALAEFRRKRPDYRIAEAMWERVKPR